MAVIQCDKGHFYDSNKFPSCPHCANPVPIRRKSLDLSHTMFLGAGAKDEKTVGVFRVNQGGDPVTGWLVCVEGKERGRDYRLHAGRNFLGRDAGNSIAIVEDESVDRQNQCSIVYEPVQNEFILLAGQSGDILVNEQPVRESVVLTGDEVIAIGEGRYVFVAFCREERKW